MNEINKINELAEIRKTVCEILNTIKEYLKEAEVASEQDKRYIYSRINKILDDLKQILSQ